MLSTSAPRWKSRVDERRAEALGLVQRRRLERGHDRERRALVVQQALDRLGPRDEAVVHRLEVQEELGDVLEELAAEDAVGHLVEGPARDVDARACRACRRRGTAA